MKKVEFGKNTMSQVGHIIPSWNEVDLINGDGEYLGLLRAGSNNFLVTKTISSGQGKYDGKIMVNEIDYDVYCDGGIVFYYNNEKSNECLDLENIFNRPDVKKIVEKGKIIEILNVSYYVSSLTKLFEERFIPYRDDSYNIDDESIRKYNNIEKNEKIVVTGIPGDVFEDLKETKKKMHMSVYEMSKIIMEKQNIK